MDPFVAEIRIFGFDFPPKGWAECNGQLLPISQNTALFSLLGTTYGGDGRSTFGLPNLQDRMPMQPDQGPGLSLRDLGEMGGEAAVALLPTEIPLHNHSMNFVTTPASTAAPTSSTGLAASGVAHLYTASTGTAVAMPTQAIGGTGNGQAHENRQPYLGLTFCIALQGVFPPRW